MARPTTPVTSACSIGCRLPPPFGFIESYSRYVSPLSRGERSQAFAEGAAAARLYGALGAPTSHIVFSTTDGLIEAPNWTPDGPLWYSMREVNYGRCP